MTLTYQPLTLGPMQQCGSFLRRALQNESMVPLDLLVREAVQNSLDAAGDGVEKVSVDLCVRNHSVDDIAGILGDIGHALRARHAGPSRLLEIRDSNTHGLSGPLTLQHLEGRTKHGNLLKLVYEVGKTQEREAAGGSWGLGKTVYFRMGIGLVFYYSRILEATGLHAERLAVCLVEDESSPERIQTANQTGIAWWGAAHGGPLTDPLEIASVLASLGVRPYAGTETGTSVVLPFLRSDLGPASLNDFDVESSGPVPVAQGESYDRHIEGALQRWYGVRLDNPSFRGGPWLQATVGGRPIKRSQMLPVFQIAQTLFNVTGQTPQGIPPELDIRIVDIVLNGAVKGDTRVGRLAMVKLSVAQLKMTAPDNNASPFFAIYGRDSSAPFRPIIGFLRGPGMIVRWDDRGDSRGWSRGFSGFDQHYLIALFVPDAERPLHPRLLAKLGRESWTLEGYLRSCEMADHLQWTDPAGSTVVQRIKDKVGAAIKAFGIPPIAVKPVEPPLQAARALADSLLPRGFGADGRTGAPGRPPGPPPQPKGSGLAIPWLEVSRVDHTDTGVTMHWKLWWGSAKTSCMIVVQVDSERRPFTRAEWMTESLGEFPIVIDDVALGPVTQDERFSLHALGDKPSVFVDTTENSSAVIVGALGGSLEGYIAEGSLRLHLNHPSGMYIQPVLTTVLTRAGQDT